MKRILAIVLSIAILVMAFPFGVFAAESSTIDTWDGTQVEPTATDADGNILINTAEELAWIALRGDAATAGKSYKVADGITAFYLTPNGADSYDNSSFDKLKETLSADTDLLGATLNKWVCKAYVHDIGGWASFQGSFDGNGITIYGLPGQSTDSGSNGLFPYIKGDVSFKNIKITDSYISSNNNVGAIFGSTFNNTNTLNSISVEKCFVVGNYLEQAKAGTANGWNNVAGLGGSIGVVTKSVLVDNCAIVDNHIVNASAVNNMKTRAFFGNFLNYDTAVVTVSIKNSFTDLNTYANGYYPNNNVNYSNIYTTNTETADFYTGHDVTVLSSTDDMKGAAAKANMELAWNTHWFVGDEGEYPSINFGEPYVDPCVWDGSFTEPTETDAEGNIIIRKASEMAWVALRGDTATEGKSYKVADGIEYFDMNGMEGITADSTAADVNAATKINSNKWHYAADNKVGAFRGNFNGNGVTIYNIYSSGYGYGGLFPFVLGDTTIENVIVKASFISGYHFTGGIVGSSELQKTLNINKCIVENCYITDNGNTNTACQRGAAQFVGGTGNSNVNISNCFALNNTVSAAGFEAGFIAKSGDYQTVGTSIENSISIGSSPYSNAKIGTLGKGLTEKLTVSNVYSDVACDVTGFITLAKEQMQGDAAKLNMSLLWNTDWFVGGAGKYPTINFGEPVKDPYLWDGTFTEPTETDAEGNIIIKTASEMAWIALRGGDATIGKNYKVADGVKSFNMNGMVGITANSTSSDVKAAVKTSYKWSLAADANTPAFQGNFDGNGVVAYNIATNKHCYSGLFPVVKPSDGGSITVKNVAVVASDIRAYHNAGGVIGLANAPTTNSSFVLENCMVKNCFISDGADANTACQRTVATLVGGLSHNATTINNCVAINNELSAQGIIGGFVSNSSSYGGAITISNSVSVGSTAEITALTTTPGSKIANITYTNVFTDKTSTATGVTTLENSKMSGAVASVTMDVLNDSVWFFNTTTYPELRVFHTIANGACEDCGLAVAGDPCALGHKLVAVPAVEATNFTDGTLAHDKCSVCDKTFIDGVEKAADELVIPMLAKTWNGTFVEPKTTDANGNIVINTPEELAWVALRGGTATEGKNYIVAKNSVFNLNGMVGITPFSTVADVKAAAKNDACKWQFETDDYTATFMGNFDGNGLVVYNIYTAKGRFSGGLFPVIKPSVGGTLTVKNVTVLASHIGGYHYAGSIVGLANAPTTDTKFTLENCVVKNTYIYDNNDTNSACQRTTGVLVGNLGHNATTINNCLVADNEISAQGIIGGLFGNSSAYCSSITVKNVISVGTSVQPMMVNYLISDKVSQAVYSNVYTDQIASASGITILTPAQMQGSAAADNMDLNWNINWAVGADGEYPSVITDNSFYDEWDGTFTEPTQTDAEGNILITSAEEMAWVALRGGAATDGKNYKVADGIKYFNMNGMVGITVNSTIDDVKDATKSTTNLWRFANDDKSSAFMGNFDGNGLTVYNIYSGTGRGFAGLFPATKPADNTSLTLKNVAVIASDIRAYHNAGAIVGIADANSSAVTLLIENCVVKECFVSDNNDQNNACQRTAGVIVGNISHNITTINNCLAVNNEISAQGIIGGIFGNASEYSGGINVSNVISIGTSVESAAVNYAISSKVANAVYENVYTDQATILEGVNTLSVEAMSGKNALTNTSLDWNAWFATNGLPELRTFHTITAVDNGDGTHTESCDDCNAGGIAVNHNYDNDYDATCNDCGAVREVAELVIGDTSGDGIINNKDLAVLMQYINGWDVTVISLAADVNNDGKVNNKDYAILIRYINGWDVTLG